jgi:hypothetical protein
MYTNSTFDGNNSRIKDYFNYYSQVGTKDKYWGLYFLPLYYFYLLLELGLLIGGAIVLSENSSDECEDVFARCVISVVLAAASLVGVFVTIYIQGCNFYPQKFDWKQFINTIYHVFLNSFKFAFYLWGIYLFVNSGCIYQPQLWILFQVIFWYYTVYFASLFGPIIVYYCVVLVTICFSSFFCFNCIRCETGGGVHV